MFMCLVRHFVWTDKRVLPLQHLEVWKLTDSCMSYLFFKFAYTGLISMISPQRSILSIHLVGLVRDSYHSESYSINDCIIQYPHEDWGSEDTIPNSRCVKTSISRKKNSPVFQVFSKKYLICSGHNRALGVSIFIQVCRLCAQYGLSLMELWGIKACVHCWCNVRRGFNQGVKRVWAWPLCSSGAPWLCSCLSAASLPTLPLSAIWWKGRTFEDLWIIKSLSGCVLHCKSGKMVIYKFSLSDLLFQTAKWSLSCLVVFPRSKIELGRFRKMIILVGESTADPEVETYAFSWFSSANTIL